MLPVPFLTEAFASAGSVIAPLATHTPALLVSLTTSAPSMESVDEINVVATVTNVGNQDIRVFK